MRLYEGMFLVDNSEARRDYDAVNRHVAGIIEKYGGEVKHSERWAERKLAYPVKRRDRGTYILVYFGAPKDSIVQIKRDCVIDEVVLRAMILRANAVPEKPEKETGTEEVSAPETVQKPSGAVEAPAPSPAMEAPAPPPAVEAPAPPPAVEAPAPPPAMEAPEPPPAGDAGAEELGSQGTQPELQDAPGAAPDAEPGGTTDVVPSEAAREQAQESPETREEKEGTDEVPADNQTAEGGEAQ